MTQFETKKIDETEIKRYLFAEMDEAEKGKFEEAFFLDDDLFFEVTDSENKLVDLYATGKLAGSELTKFEKSLEKFPERQEKVAAARALQTYIEEERPPVAVLQIEPESETFWQKLSGFFTIQSPAFGTAMATLLVMFAIGGVLLFLDNRQKNEEIARLQNEKQGIDGNSQKREEELKGQLANSNQRIEDLKNQLNNKEEDAEDLIKTLNNEQRKTEQLQREIEKIRQEKNIKLPPQTQPQPEKPAAPEIASVVLKPGKERIDDRMTKTSVGDKTRKVAVNMALPDNLKKDELYTVQLNGQPYLNNVSLEGKKSLSLTIPTKNLPVGENKLTVVDSQGKEITNYVFKVDKP